MKKAGTLLLLVFLLAVISAPLSAQTPAPPAPPADETDEWAGIAKTRWSDPSSSPMTYDEYIALNPQGGPFTVVEKATVHPPGGSGRQVGGTGLFLVVVNSALEPLIQPKLDDYVASVAAEGYTVTLLTMSGGTPVDVRNTLASRLPSGLIGAVLIGELPVPWYEVSGSQFPCDLFYMDLDGTWTDQDKNGVYDLHQTSEAPDIFVGRLTAAPLIGQGQGSEYAKVNRYFKKIDKYRTGQFTVNARALAYPDDDWHTFGPCGLTWLYSDVVVVSDKATTNGDDYKLRLRENYEWIHVCVHSWPGGHSFSPSGTVYSSDIQAIDPTAHFYNLFACSNCHYTTKDYQGGWYVFAETHGLAAVGSTKSGSMLDFPSFYAPLGRHETLGAAFREWFAAQHPYSTSDQEWFYGMTLLGDPMLLPSETQLFTALPSTLSASKGGVLYLGLEMNGKIYGDREYQILLSLSGTEPRTPLQGILVPLVFDRLTAYAFNRTNSSMFAYFRDRLNTYGTGGGTLRVPPLASVWVGRTLYCSALIINPLDYATRPLEIPIVP